jgi:hypothetical protein
MKKKMPPKDPFQSIAAVDLASVNGGRLIANKGPDAAVVMGLETLVKTLSEVGQTMAQSGQQQSSQMMGLMQQMMEKRKAGG